MESILGGNAQSNLVDQMKTAPKDKRYEFVLGKLIAQFTRKKQKHRCISLFVHTSKKIMCASMQGWQ
jgi:hypothetical protein